MFGGGLKRVDMSKSKEVFTSIYQNSIWGKSMDLSEKFYSGPGSRDEGLVGAYIDSTTEFLAGFADKPDVVDLGCGDFFVGSKIRCLCNRYVACDVVHDLIVFNRMKYKDLSVDFMELDLTHDDLPLGDVVFIRQVFQHLSNSDIGKVIPKLCSKYKFAVITEHLPMGEMFVPNIDKPTDNDIRIAFQSGVVVTAPPFNLNVLEERVLCNVVGYGGRIKTTLYRLI